MSMLISLALKRVSGEQVDELALKTVAGEQVDKPGSEDSCW